MGVPGTIKNTEQYVCNTPRTSKRKKKVVRLSNSVFQLAPFLGYFVACVALCYLSFDFGSMVYFVSAQESSAR